MRIAWFQLFRVRLRHGFYADGESKHDFACLPAPSTAELLRWHALRLHRFADGFGVFAEVDPSSLPNGGDGQLRLRALQGDEVLRMQFQLVLLNPWLINFTELPAFRPGAEVFYFDNLRSDSASGRLHLGDSVAGARIGAPIGLVTGPEYTHRLPAPARSGRLELRDMFGKLVHVATFDFAGAPEPTPVHRLDLSAIDAAVPGRYRVSDDQGGARDIYYAPETFKARPFAVLEVFSTTKGIADGNDKVPVSYRVFQGDRIRGASDFNVQWQPRQTLWRYSVTKKYVVPAPGIGVDSLQIGDGTEFDAVVGGTEKVTFTAKAPRALSQQPADLVLNHNGNKRIRKLPSPRPETPLKKESVGAGQRDVSELFIYI
jgi:hypothetical protein